MRSRLFVLAAVTTLAAGVTVLAGCVDAFRQEPANLPATWDDVDAIIHASNAHCLNCHSKTAPNNQGYLATGYSLESCADATGLDGSGLAMVVPGDADGSPLIWRLEGHTDTGAPVLQMPLDSPGSVTTSQIQTIRRWIDQGAACP